MKETKNMIECPSSVNCQLHASETRNHSVGGEETF